MALADMTREYIKRFSGSTMFERGEGYYRSGNVTNLEYDGDAATITADVEGNYDDYCEPLIRIFLLCRTSSDISNFGLWRRWKWLTQKTGVKR